MNKLIKNTDGISTIEYVILLMLIACVGIVAWRTFGNTVVGKFCGHMIVVTTKPPDPPVNKGGGRHAAHVIEEGHRFGNAHLFS